MAVHNAISYDRHEASIPAERIARALDGAQRHSYWLQDPMRPNSTESLNGALTTDLLVIGGGYTGLWTALQAKERDPSRRVVLLEGQRIGWAASGRNGGFCEASLVHGESNGARHLPEENDRLGELGQENLDEIQETIRRYGMDVDFVRAGSLTVATEEHHIDWAKEEAQGPGARFLNRTETRQLVNSPDFLAGVFDERSTALVHPAKLAWELARVCRELGVEIYEHSQVQQLREQDGHILAYTADGCIAADRVALATNVFPSLLKRLRPYTIPVYDYALMTEPLTAEQRRSIGFEQLIGLADMNNRFHYVRPTIDPKGGFRLLYGGYDAVYHFGGQVSSRFDQNPETFHKLAAHFFGSFPQLDHVKFSHAWGGAIDTCSRFFSFFDLSHAGQVAYCAGFTGLGVGATRFGAKAMLDLLSGEDTELTRLKMVRRKPIPFPPEPAAWMGVKMMTRDLIKADRSQGERSKFLKLMDAVGMGFDS